MALPADYRIVVVNETGVQVDSGLVEVDLKPYSGDGSGGLSHGTEQTATLGSNLSAGGSTSLLEVNGSTSVGLNGNVNGNLSTNGATPSGDLEFYIERSTDGGSPSSGTFERDPTPIAVLNYSSKTDKSTTISA